MKTRGFGLIEIILTLAVAATLLVIGISRYQQASIQRNAVQLKESARLIMDATRQYYLANCTNLYANISPDNKTLTVSGDLKKFLPDLKSVANPLSVSGANLSSFQPSLRWVPDFGWDIVLKADMSPAYGTKQIKVYMGMVRPSSIKKLSSGAYQFIWSQPVRADVKSQVSKLDAELAELVSFAQHQHVDTQDSYYQRFKPSQAKDSCAELEWKALGGYDS